MLNRLQLRSTTARYVFRKTGKLVGAVLARRMNSYRPCQHRHLVVPVLYEQLSPSHGVSLSTHLQIFAIRFQSLQMFKEIQRPVHYLQNVT